MHSARKLLRALGGREQDSSAQPLSKIQTQPEPAPRPKPLQGASLLEPDDELPSQFDDDEAAPKSGIRLTREMRRSRRKRAVKSRTISTMRMAKAELEAGRALYPEFVTRPVQREECKDGPRPCPYVSCRYHLYLDVSPHTGSIKLNFPDLEVWELEESCALDVAERGAVQVERLGAILNLTRERVRQLEVQALRAIHDDLATDG